MFQSCFFPHFYGWWRCSRQYVHSVSEKQIRTVDTGITWRLSVEPESSCTCPPQWRTARGKVCETDGCIWRQVKDSQSLSLGPCGTSLSLQYARLVDQPVCVSTKRSFRSRVQNVYVIASRIMADVTGCLGGWRLYTRENLGVQRNNNRDSLYAHVYNSINNRSPSDLKVNRVFSLRNSHPFAVSFAYPSHALSIV
jgi:hypothetical protein